MNFRTHKYIFFIHNTHTRICIYVLPFDRWLGAHKVKQENGNDSPIE